MPSPVEQNLHTLLPTCNFLPPNLISLATSILAQSKAVAPTLKADEEIARTYACCHIACERSANKLALDIGRIAPPCGPRVYKKLHAYLDGIVTAGRTQSASTPKGRKTGDGAVKTTPQSTSKRREVTGVSKIATPTKSLETLGKRKRATAARRDGVAVPKQIAHLSRHLCEAMKFPQAALHVYAGLESLYRELPGIEKTAVEERTPKRSRINSTPQAPEPDGESFRAMLEEDKTPLLVIAVCQAVFTKMQPSDSTTEMTETIFGEVIAYLRENDEDLSERVFADRYEDIAVEIDEFFKMIRDPRLSQEWYRNVPELPVAGSENIVETRDDDDDDEGPITPRKKSAKTPLRRKEKHATAGSDADDPGAAGLLPGLGTMFQPAVDWLSDERVADYSIWKRGIMKELAAIEQSA